MARRADVDWELVERDYRIGVLTISQLVTKHGVSKAAIHRRAAKHEWSRDLSEQVRVATKAKVNAAIIDSETESRLKRDYRDAYEVESHANVNFGIVTKHHQHAGRLENLMLKMVGELEEQTDNRVSLAQIKVMIAEQDPNTAQAIHKLTSVGSRMATLKAATEIHEKVVKIERQAFNLDAEQEKPMPELERLAFAMKNDPRVTSRDRQD